MRKSVFNEFFCLCAAVLSSAVICVGVVLLVVSIERYKDDRADFLERKIDILLEEVYSSVNENGEINVEKMKNICDTMSEYVNVDITLTDPDGVALVCTEASPCSHTDKKISKDTLSRITEDGLYELSSLDGFYDSDGFILGYKITCGKHYYLFARARDNRISEYVLYLVVALIVAAAIVMSAALTIIYTSTKRLLTPIKEMTMAARRFGDGDFSEKLHIADENELGFLANSLNEMATSLEEFEETRKSFISNVSHELKTPMTTIGGFIDGILDGTIPQEQHRHYLKIVSKEVSRLARLVRSMLNISKYEAGELTLSTEDFDVLPVVVQTLMNFEKRIEEKNIDIQGLENAEAFCLNADPDLTQQVIYNLVENAVKFVNKGGYISFSFSEEPDGMRSISIRNSGDGLSEKEISKVFERFYKTDESRGIDPGGVGLGLSIVSSIIKLHDGTIVVSSEPDQFTEFTFTLKKALNDRK